MARDRAEDLLRKPENPQQATFLELFFDLVFVFTLTRIVDRMVADLNRPGVADRWIAIPRFAETLLLLLPVAWVWTMTAWTTSRFNPRRPPIQAVVVATMFGTLILSAALPDALGQRGLTFAAAYVTIQVGRPLFFMVTLRGHELRRAQARECIWFALTAPLWLIGGVVPQVPRLVLWAVAVNIDYLVTIGGWPVPRLGRSRTTVWAKAGEHLAERYRQLLIIALGESVLVVGGTYVGGDFTLSRKAALAVAFATTVLFWRIYFYRAGQILGPAVNQSASPTRLGRAAAYAHLTMIAGIMVASTGSELVIDHPLDRAKPGWIMAIVGGPILYLAGRSRFEHVVFARLSPSRLIACGVLVLLSPLMLLGPQLVAALAASSVLLAVATSDALRARGKPEEEPAYRR